MARRVTFSPQDSFGYSPLHIAALNEYSYCANLLLCSGADITTRTNGGTSVLSMIVRKIPNVLPKFEDMLDQAVTLAEHDINDVDCELKLDFKVLIPNRCKGESGMFMAFIETGHNHLLKHPLCESFLHLKWLKAGGEREREIDREERERQTDRQRDDKLVFSNFDLTNHWQSWALRVCSSAV